MKTKLIKAVTNNFLLKLIGLILAVILWLVLSNMQDSVEKRIIAVPIVYDETYLNDNGYVAVGKPSSVAVQVWIRKSNISKLGSNDFIAKVDTSEFLGAKIKPAPESTKFILEISKKTAATYIEDWDYPKLNGRYIELEVDKIKSEMYTVGVNLTGEAPGGIRIDENQIISTPQRVLVKGPTNDFSALNTVKAVVDLSSIVLENGTGTVTAKLQMYDGNNRQLNNTDLTLSEETVEVKLGVVASKTASVNVAGYMGTPAIGYGCRDYDYEPKSVTITGTENALSQVTTITIPKTELDITDASENMTFEVNMEKYLPADISIAEEHPKNVTVTVTIEKLDEEIFLLSTENLQMIGCKEDYEYEIMSSTVEITLRAFKEELTAEKVSEAHLQGSINVTGIEPGEKSQMLPVLLSMDSQYSLVGDVEVEVMVRHKEDVDITAEESSDAVDE